MATNEAARLPVSDPWDLLRSVDSKARADAQQALIIAYAALGRTNGGTLRVKGLTTGRLYTIVVTEDQGGPQLAIQD